MISIVANTCFSSHAKQTLANYYSIQSENVNNYLDILRINHCQNNSQNWGKQKYSNYMSDSVYSFVMCKFAMFVCYMFVKMQKKKKIKQK